MPPDSPADALCRALSLRLLEEGERPSGAASVPRQPRWWDTLAYIADPDGFCLGNLKRHGPVFRSGVFGGTTVFVGSRTAVRMALNGDDIYSEIGLPPTTMEMFGEYSLFQRPDLHRRRKSALRPAFTGSMLAGYVPHMHRLVELHLGRWRQAGSIDLQPALECWSFELLVPLLLGIPLQEGEEQGLSGLPIATSAELKRLYQRFYDGFFGLVRWKSPLTAFGRGWIARERLMAFMEAVIQRRMEAAAPAEAEPHRDLLGMMLADRRTDPDSPFDVPLMANQCLLQLWGAHYEVTSLACSWIHQVAAEPGVLERLRNELAGTFGAGEAPSSATAETLRRLPYLDATIRETLRVLPPTSTAARRLTRSLLLDGVLYEKGWKVIAEPRLAHRLEDTFPDPHRFRPERFLAEEGEAGADLAYAFIPFGGGVHACIGAQMALTIMKVLAIHLVATIDWQRRGEATFREFPLRMIRPGCRIDLQPR